MQELQTRWVNEWKAWALGGAWKETLGSSSEQHGHLKLLIRGPDASGIYTSRVQCKNRVHGENMAVPTMFVNDSAETEESALKAVVVKSVPMGICLIS